MLKDNSRPKAVNRGGYYMYSYSSSNANNKTNFCAAIVSCYTIYSALNSLRKLPIKSLSLEVKAKLET